jgi:tRNA threonylcarbamoyladenosine biosynthesis protein TsaE
MADSVFLANEVASVAFGSKLAAACQGRGLVTLSGTLGTGKTTLSRGIIRALGHSGAVKSPTFTLVEPYELRDTSIYHFDLYRLEDPEELEFIGLWDYLDQDALVLVEWPEKAFGVLPPADLALDLAIQDNGRRVAFAAHTSRGQDIAKALAST